MRSLRILLLYVARALGLFALAQHITRTRLRILCYHGFAIGDEYRVMPFMFMRGDTFERRMQVLQKRGLPVVSLDEGVSRLEQRTVDRAQTVITLDDGWETNLTIALPILQRHGFPATIYVTTEHLATSAEVFNVVLCYMLFSTNRRSVVLSGIHPSIDGSYDLVGDDRKEATAIAVIRATERHYALSERMQVLRPVAAALGFDLDDVLRERRFRLLEPAQMVELHEAGIDMQLHSHTHRLPDESFAAVAAEITENRRALAQLIGREQNHFCYPSGRYAEQHPEWLSRLGIASATTCDTGFNGPQDHPLLLKRYLDRDDATDIEFEAEVSGLRELARQLRALPAKRKSPPPTARRHQTTTANEEVTR